MLLEGIGGGGLPKTVSKHFGGASYASPQIQLSRKIRASCNSALRVVEF
jgi:hypothetical protein